MWKSSTGIDFFRLSKLTQVTVSWSDERNCACISSSIGNEMLLKITSSTTWLYSRERMRLFPPTTTLCTHSFTASSDWNDGEKLNSRNPFSVLLPTHSPIFISDLSGWDNDHCNLKLSSECCLVLLTVAPVPCLLHCHYQQTVFLKCCWR